MTKIDKHPQTIKLIDYLSDQEWHDYKQTLEDVSPVVDRDQALDRAEYYRNRHYVKTGRPPTKRKNGSTEDSIRTGQRLILSRSIQSLVRRGLIEIEHDDSNPKRKKPLRLRSLA